MTFQTIFANGVNPFGEYTEPVVDLKCEKQRNTERKHKVAEFICTHPGCSVMDIAQGINDDRKHVRVSIRYLQYHQRLIATGAGWSRRFSMRTA